MNKEKGKSRLIKTLLVLLTAFVFVCIPLAAVPEKAEAANVTVSLTPEYKQSAARNMLKPLNTWRRQKNWYYTSSNTKAWIKAGELPNLKYDYTLEKHAMLRAAEIALNFDHTRPDGTGKSGLIGNGYVAVGENIYASTSESAKDPNYVLNKFKEEDSKFNYQGHRRNMLSMTWTADGRRDLGYDSVGVSCIKFNGCYYWVQIFGRSSNKPNTKSTTALTSTRTTGMTLNTSMVRRKKTPDFSLVKNYSLFQGASMTLGKVYINIGLEESWPDAYVTVAENPSWTSKNANILTINSNIAYGNSPGTTSAVAKEAITGKTKTVSVTVSKSKIKNGLVKEGGNWHYYKNGNKVTGWVNLTAKDGKKTPGWFFFEYGTGNMYTGWHWMSNKEGEKTGHWSYFGPDGAIRTGWTQFGKGTNNPDGNNAAHWSYFGPNGWLRTGWQEMGTSANPDNGKKHWSYFGGNGWLVTGWKYFTKKEGESVPHWSYFGSNGWMRTGWQYLGKADGQSTPHWSYFGSRGWLATGKYRINGKVYSFSSGGWLVSPKSP